MPSTVVWLASTTLCWVTGSLAAQVPFQRIEISANAGDVKLAGDIDLDGTADVILGGSLGEDLNWYQYPTWTRTRIAVPSVEFTTDGAIGDVDSDGDLDLVVPDGPSGTNLFWFENPARLPGGGRGDPFAGNQWQRRAIGAVGSWCKDVELADFDGDGRMDVAVRENASLMIFFADASSSWSRTFVPGSALGNEGLASGDLDGDGAADLVLRGIWLCNPRGPAARSGANWAEFTIAASGVDDDFKALVADLDRDGSNDVLFSSSEGTADVAWYAYGGTPTGAWTRRLIASNVDRAHTLQVADVDGDGDADVVVAQMHTAVVPALRVFFNQGGALTWQVQVVDQQYGLHNGVVVDLGGDGDFEIVGSNWTGNPPLQYWHNATPQDRQRIAVPVLRSGASATLFVTNAHLGVPVCLCATAAGVTTPYPIQPLGITFALVDPVFLGVASSGLNGAAAFEIALPSGLTGLGVWFQAFEFGRSSIVVGRVLR